MKDEQWRALADDELERLLVERWLYRGAILALVLGAAILTTYLGVRGVSTGVDRLTVGVLLALVVVAGAGGFVMRLQDIRMQQELRRRRAGRPR